MDAVSRYPLFFVLFWASANSIPVSPVYDSNVRLPRVEMFKPWTNCTEIAFGFTGIKVPVCKTFVRYSLTKPPLVTCQIGKVDSHTSDELRQAFRGILMSKQHSPTRGQPAHDNDMCCPTTRRLEQASSRMKNSFGESRDIVYLPSASLYQFYHAGSCVTSSELMNCHGTCVQEMSTVYLMVFRLDLPMHMSFEPFDVPSYCSCKNLGRDSGRNVTSIPTSIATSIPTTVKPTERSTRIVHQRLKPSLRIPPGPIRVHYGKVVSKEMLRRPQPPPRPRYVVRQREAARADPRPHLTSAHSTVTPLLSSNNNNNGNDTVTVQPVTPTVNASGEAIKNVTSL